MPQDRHHPIVHRVCGRTQLCWDPQEGLCRTIAIADLWAAVTCNPLQHPHTMPVPCLAPRSCSQSPVAGNSQDTESTAQQCHCRQEEPGWGVSLCQCIGQLLRAGLLGEGIFNCKLSLVERCRVAAKKVGTRSTRLLSLAGGGQK